MMNCMKNFYRSKQNNEIADFDDSFLYISQLQCEKAIYAKRFTEEMSLGTTNDVESKNYVVRVTCIFILLEVILNQKSMIKSYLTPT